MERIVLLIGTSRSFGKQLLMCIASYLRLNSLMSYFREPIGLKSSICCSLYGESLRVREELINKML